MRRADVIVAAMGSAGFVTPDKIKDGAVLVDVGVSRVYDEEAGRYRIKGDVDKACYDKASAYTPPERGPMTRAMLLANVVEMAERTPRVPRIGRVACIVSYLYACRVCV